MKNISLIALLVQLSCMAANGQHVVRNLGFEDLDAKGNLLCWDPRNSTGNYVLNLDTSMAHTGQCSFFIRPSSDTVSNRGMGGCTSIIKGYNLETNRVVRISAYIKTENLQNGVAALVVQFGSDKGSMGDYNSNDQSLTGTTGWTKHTVNVRLLPGVQFIGFGFVMTGTGKAWFDDFEIFFDDAPAGESIYLPKNGKPVNK